MSRWRVGQKFSTIIVNYRDTLISRIENNELKTCSFAFSSVSGSGGGASFALLLAPG